MKFEEAVKNIDDVDRDIIWSLLKRKDSFGIKRKIVCMARVLKVSPDELLAEAKKGEDGRILDKENRHIINEILLKNEKIGFRQND